MRQVPTKPLLLVGSGRLATHLSYYLKTQKITFNTWTRKDSQDQLLTQLTPETITLLAISDDAIEGFIEAHPDFKGQWVHFSGSLYHNKAIGLHPLMTFSKDLYDLDTYKQIPFVVDKGQSFVDIFPSLENPSFELDPQLKSYYHALLVVGGNFTAMLWKEVAKRFERQLKLPSAILKPYILQTFFNIIRDPNTAVTGPIERSDKATILRNLNALSGTKLQGLYYSFLDLAKSQKSVTKSKSIFHKDFY